MWGRIQKRKTKLLQIITFGLQRAAGPYRWASYRPFCNLGCPVALHIRSQLWVIHVAIGVEAATVQFRRPASAPPGRAMRGLCRR